MRVSARARIVGWMLAVVGLALSVSISTTWTFLVNRLDDRIGSELRNEVDKLRSYAKETRDPQTGRTVTDVQKLLTDYLALNSPDRWETFFSIVDGSADRVTAIEPLVRLDTDAELVGRMAKATRITRDTVESDAGTVQYAVIPVTVSGDSRPGHFVVAIFYDRHRGEIVDAVWALGLSALAALVLAGAAGWFVAGRVLAPVRLIGQTAEQISDSTDLTRRLDVPGDDDVAALAATFNHMLDRLEKAFVVQRNFMDDAGHELRTPITVIRGHLELMSDDPADRAATLALVTDELDRMNRIVDDLITLAKAEQPGFLHLDNVELADLTVSVVAKARPLGERRWRVDEVAEARLPADRQRLTQALMQLVANAVRHTADDDLIAVGSAVRDGRVDLWVRDSGPGVAPAERERIFGRFVRGAGRTGTYDGAGLGLAIVRSIAEAHGGGVKVTEGPGGGACFVISLPLWETWRLP
ncbi:HAMP domain-containing histidine kinase [Streptosporangium sp. NBC_01755]|uniref:sensor histidine kinase n=1 Tax=unclassified Streptosporangium TaxID=2632669 RepID=UPI002DDA3DDD|nr:MULTISPECIES: HAMP domain-containing sensor histidine kinase [unclassified Streptosporangium]WSA24687.1 HAMP domain-containing histidine kinase [Streptosporangium sp. NBC_01810]WSC97236.1 HAMP domain-containing histidine kinase [Streptosporangium sp. NBC_01755]